MRSGARCLVYPAIAIAAVTATWLTYVAHDSDYLAVAAGNTVAIVASTLAERILPYRPIWNRSHGDVWTDLCHFAVSSGGMQLVAALLFIPVARIASSLAAGLGSGLWPRQLPFAAQVAIALLVGELGYYWLHRAFHHTALWRVHAVHHSAPRMYWLNSNRNHPVDFLLAIIVMTGPLILMNAPKSVLVVETEIAFSIMLLQHANIDMRLGALNRLFVGGEAHRWHHSRVPEEQNTNFGGVLMVWDVLFGTFFFPRDREPPSDIGLTDMPEFPQGFLGQVASPVSRRLWRRDSELDS